ncbi:uncharacterized protein LY89DRAFT_690772 [Mollisia scopiformis]|uniref:Uncharacterized protein n=1 Tax=Mollisia scopiformis TaxID=149040 RepID=A0A132B8L9_MOLSC|nr:uncharacterized protein LY89DRAFT_690772 [Mollisia scopiformis]KUJ08760.1 hypothetical protein LY89DRAFT_690772 [Mollisia scopiformis]
MSILASGVPVQEYAKAVRRTHPPQSAYAPYPSPSTMVPYAPSNYQYAATQAPYQQPSASTSGQYITASTTTTTSNVDQPGYMYTPLGYFLIYPSVCSIKMHGLFR